MKPHCRQRCIDIPDSLSIQFPKGRKIFRKAVVGGWEARTVTHIRRELCAAIA